MSQGYKRLTAVSQEFIYVAMTRLVMEQLASA